MSSMQPSVCVVGAGLSGLRCADVLLQHGFQVTILEARDRIGGRVCQSESLGYPVDIGPNWIHTSDDGHRTPILEIAKRTNTPLHRWNDKQYIYDSNGVCLPDEKADHLSTLLWEIILEAMESSLQDCQSSSPTIDPKMSLKDFIIHGIGQRFGEDSVEERDLLTKMSEMWGAYIGDEVSKQSLKFAWMEECCGGDAEMFVETTWQPILAEIARTPLEKACVRLEEAVVKVNTRERSVKGGKVKVQTAKGEILEFDEVVMTTPLGWLKTNRSVFTPSLPPRLQAGIEAVSVGHLEKVYVYFPTAWWLDPSSSGDTFPGYTNWLRPNYASETNPEQWPIEMWNLASFKLENRKPTMIFYLYGALSHHIINLVTQMAPTEHHKTVSDFFKPYYSLLPNYQSRNPDCEPKAVLSTEWAKDEFAGYGSYCNFQIGIQDAKGDVEAMRRGQPERRLWFAGEHTGPFEELGTAAGAYLSGEDVAGRILEVYDVEMKERI